MLADDSIVKNSSSLRFKMSRSRHWHARIISGFLASIGIGSFFVGEDYIRDHISVGIVCFALSLFILYFSQSAKKQEIALIINSEGLWFCDWELPVIPWRYITNAYSSGSRFRPLLYVELRDSKTFFGSVDTKIRERLSRNPLIKDQHLVVPASILQTPVSEIAEKIRSRLPKPETSGK